MCGGCFIARLADASRGNLAPRMVIARAATPPVAIPWDISLDCRVGLTPSSQ